MEGNSMAKTYTLQDPTSGRYFATNDAIEYTRLKGAGYRDIKTTTTPKPKRTTKAKSAPTAKASADTKTTETKTEN